MTGFDADVLHYTHQGSGLLPLSLIRALEDSRTGRPYLENLERFGLLPGEKSDRNPEGWPVGIVTNKVPVGAREIEMFGFTCAACHTSDFHYRGKVVRVDGASGLFDVDAFGDAIGDSIQATLESPDKLWAFLKRFRREGSQAPAEQTAGVQLLGEFQKLIENEEDRFGIMLAKHLQQRVAGLLEQMKQKSTATEASAPSKEELVALAKKLAAEIKSDGNPLKSLLGEKRQAAVVEMLQHFEDSLANLRYRLEYFKSRDWIAKPGHRLRAGYGRADDFGTARVELFRFWNDKNLVPLDAPVSVPPIWKVDRYAWIHWNANTNSIIQRSMGEAIGVGATFNAQTLETSVDIVNQMKIEREVQKLTPPAWPSAVFGAPDPAKVQRGAKLYQQACAECHTPAGVTSTGLEIAKLYSVQETGTDPADAGNFDRPLFDSEGKELSFAGEIAKLMNAIQTAARAKMTPANQQLMDELERDRRPVKWRDTQHENHGKVYPARPLEGIWATAPYLHNGSVPTLFDLLLPANKRPANFPVGHKDYDPVKVGFTLVPADIHLGKDQPQFILDTTVPGNLNTGHEYGTDWTEQQKFDLVEYLKVHKDPPSPKNVIGD